MSSATARAISEVGDSSVRIAGESRGTELAVLGKIVELLAPLGPTRDELLQRIPGLLAAELGYEVDVSVIAASELAGAELLAHEHRAPIPDPRGVTEALRLMFLAPGSSATSRANVHGFLCVFLATVLANSQRYHDVVAAEEKYHAIFDNSPEGIVVLDIDAPEGPWPIRDCNPSFYRMNGYTSAEELLGEDIVVVSVGQALGNVTRADYLARVCADGVVRGRDLHVRRDGSEFPVEFSTRVLRLGGRDCVIGIDRDVTEDERLRRIIDDLRRDIGRTFHTLTGTLIQVEAAISPTIAALTPGTSAKQLTPPIEVLWPLLLEDVAGCVGTLRRFVREAYESPEGKEALSPASWGCIERHIEALEQVGRPTNMPETLVPELQMRTREVLNALAGIRKGHLPQGTYRQARRLAERVELSCCCIGLRFARDRVMDTDFLVRDIRERVMTGHAPNEPRAACSMLDMVKDAIHGLAGLAAYRRLEIRLNRSQDATLQVVRHDVVRCINNLLHNAIKYSWSRVPGASSWIDVSLTQGAKYVVLTIEDYGVPVHADEIAEELIFDFGYRGRLSSDRGRIGTGVGLFDSRDVARRLGGDVTLESRPASKDTPGDQYSSPHLKTVTLRLPLAGAGGRE